MPTGKEIANSKPVLTSFERASLRAIAEGLSYSERRASEENDGNQRSFVDIRIPANLVPAMVMVIRYGVEE